MKILDVYSRFGIPRNLQEHMFRVGKVCSLIMNGWKGEIDKDVVMRAALVHDLANIVKFKLEDGNPLLIKQKEVVEKYGNDDHAAAEKMLRELRMNEDVIQIVQNKSFENAMDVVINDNWPLKILFYADMRVVPTGVVDLETRLTDVVTRLEKYRNHPQREKLMGSARMIEDQIQAMTTTNLKEIDDKAIELVSNELVDREI